MNEPPPCYLPFSTEAGGLHYLWGGNGPGKKTTSIGVFDPQIEQWTFQPTTGPMRSRLFGGGCASLGNYMYCYGGDDGKKFTNSLHKLNLENFQWSQIHPKSAVSEWPICKAGFGFIAVNERTLACFGGYGIGHLQPGSTFIKSTTTDEYGWTNELQFFDIQTSIWYSREVKGERPPPCSTFSFTEVNQNCAVLFGGKQPNYRVNEVYLFHFMNMKVTKMAPEPGEMWPEGRTRHAACCLNYDEDNPQLLVSGGLNNAGNILEDLWILDLNGRKWREISHGSLKACFRHSITASRLGVGLSEVLMFGGCPLKDYSPTNNTTLLRFECQWSSDSGAGTEYFTEKWNLVDVAFNDTRGSSQRIREKREKIRQVARERERFLKQLLQAEKLKAEVAEQRLSTSLALTHPTQSQLQIQMKKDIEGTLEGKTKELASHDTEAWKIPSDKVRTIRTIGSGGWGEVLEGAVRVAVKRLYPAVLNQRNLERLQREIQLLAEVRHPNLVQFIGAVFDQSPPLIITELLEMNLRQAYEQSQLQQGDRLSIFIDVAKALEYLHQRHTPIIHRDVSAPNVLLQQMPNNQWKGKVSDLGSANFLQNAQTMGEGAIVYSPPEVIPQPFALNTEPPPQTVKIDVYSYGILVCEVTASRFPSPENYREMFQQVQRDHPQVYELIVKCTKRDPSDRPSMAEVQEKLSNLAPF